MMYGNKKRKMCGKKSKIEMMIKDIEGFEEVEKAIMMKKKKSMMKR